MLNPLQSGSGFYLAQMNELALNVPFFIVIAGLTIYGIQRLQDIRQKYDKNISFSFRGDLAALMNHRYYQPLTASIRNMATRTRSYELTTRHKERLLELEEDKFAGSLAVIKWVEVTLPVLGFLGTVIGMMLAMEDINDEDLIVSGMRFAFLTTLFGLLGLLMVGVLHLRVKSRLALRLAEVRTNLDLFCDQIDFRSILLPDETAEEEVSEDLPSLHDLIKQLRQIDQHLEEIRSQLPGDDREKLLQNLDQRLEVVEEHLENMDMQLIQANERLEEIMHSGQDAGSVLLNARESVEKVIFEVPAFQHIKNVLFYPVLEFDDLTPELSLNIQDFLRMFPFYQEAWRFGFVWSSLQEDGNSYASIEAREEQHYIFQFNFDGNIEGYKLCSVTENYKAFIPLPEYDRCIGVDHRNQPYLIDIPKYNFAKAGKLQKAAENRINNRFTYPITGVFQIEKYGATFLFLFYLHHGFISVELINLQQLDIAFKPYRNDTLKCTDIYAMDKNTGTSYFIVSPREGERRNYMLLVLSFDVDKKKSRSFELREKINRKLLLADHIIPRKIMVLGKEEILLLDKEGSLYYWRSQLSSFVPLKNDFWKPYADKDYEIRVGTDGWIAVTVGGVMRMWQIKKQLKLVAYEELFPPKAGSGAQKTRFSVKDSVSSTFAVSADKKFIFGIQDDSKALPVWRFPVVQGDIKT